MNKYLKIGFYVLLVIAITIVALLMLGTKKSVNLETGLNPEYLPSETKEEAEFLNEIGCGRLQGFLFGKPYAIYEFEEKIKNQTWTISDNLI